MDIQGLHIRANSRIKRTFHVLCAKNYKMSCQKKCEYSFLQMLILSFLHRAHGMSFDSKNLHGCEELVYICTPFFSEFFKKITIF